MVTSWLSDAEREIPGLVQRRRRVGRWVVKLIIRGIRGDGPIRATIRLFQLHSNDVVSEIKMNL